MKKIHSHYGYESFFHDLQSVIIGLKTAKSLGCVYIWGPSDYFQLEAKKKIKEILELENKNLVASYSFKSLNEDSFAALFRQKDIFSSQASYFILDVDQDKKIDKFLKNKLNSIEKNIFFFFTNSITPNLSSYQNSLQIRCFPLLKGESRKFLSHLAKKNELSFSTEVVSLILERIGEDPFTLDNEIQKIKLFFGESASDISYDDLNSYLDAYANPQLVYAHDLILKKNFKALYDLFQKWSKEGISPLVFLGTIAKFCRNALLVNELKNNGLNSREISSKIGVPNFLVNSYTQHTRQKDVSSLVRLLIFCQDIDFKIKSSGVDPNLLIYHLISRLEEMHV